MKIFFYLWGILNLILFTFPYILEPRKNAKKLLNMIGWWKSLPNKQNSKTEKVFEFSDMPEEVKNTGIYMLIGVLSMLMWLIIGLFSFNWVVVLAFFIYSFIIGKLGGYFIKNNMENEYTVYLFIHNVIEASAVLFMVINSYHLKINVWEYLTTFF